MTKIEKKSQAIAKKIEKIIKELEAHPVQYFRKQSVIAKLSYAQSEMMVESTEQYPSKVK